MDKKHKTLESETDIRHFFKKERSDLNLKQQSQASQEIDDLIRRHQFFWSPDLLDFIHLLIVK